MKILIATDKFKDSLTAEEVRNAIESGIKNVNPNYVIDKIPLADGGEGSLDVLENVINFERIYLDVDNPLFNKIKSYYGLLNDVAYIEMAKASGLQLLDIHERKTKLTTSIGTGQMIVDAIKRGASKIFLFVGGSATTDAGVGMASALGYKFLDSSGAELKPIGAYLKNISKIDSSSAISFDGVEVSIMTDVSNTLWGLNGASHVFAKQKGATKSEINHLDSGLKNISKIWENKFGLNVSNIKGSGAAGGLGAGAVVFCNGKIKSGISTIFNLVKFEERVRKADFVISGEGLVDEQTLKGKVVKGVSEICNKSDKPFGVFCGDITLSKSKQGLLNAVFIKSIKTKNISKEDAMKNAYDYLVQLASKTISYFK